MSVGALPVDPTAVAGPGPGVIPTGPATAPVPAGPPATIPAPIPVPAVPAPPPAVDQPPTDPVQLAQQNVQATQQTGQEQVANAAEKSSLEAQTAAEKAKFDAANAKALEDFQKTQLLHQQAADAEIAAKRYQFEQQPFHSLWGTRSTGQKVAIALGLLAGGVSWNSNHVNRAVDILNQAEQEDLQRQKEQHADLWRDLQLNLDNRKELDSRQLHELSDWQSLQAAKWSAVAGKLNTLIAANKGRADVTAAEQARNEANEKANQAWSNAINAKATANHLKAQSRLTNEQALSEPGKRELTKAETAKNYAEAENQRAMAAQGGLSKLDQAFLQKFDRILNQDQDVKVLYGNDATPGPLRVLPRVAQLQEDIKTGVANHDNTKVLESVIASKELLSKLLTGGQLNETKAKVLDSIQGSPSEVRAKLNRTLGDPEASKQLVHGIYGLLDDVREQSLKLADDARSRLHKKHLGTGNPLLANPAVREAVAGKIDALTSEVKNGGGTPRYPEGGAAPSAPKMVTIRNGKTGETKTVTEDEARKLGAL